MTNTPKSVIHKLKDAPSSYLGMPTNWEIECEFEAWNGCAASKHWNEVTCPNCLDKKRKGLK